MTSKYVGNFPRPRRGGSARRSRTADQSGNQAAATETVMDRAWATYVRSMDGDAPVGWSRKAFTAGYVAAEMVAKVEREHLRAALTKYGKHMIWCNAYAEDCTCGFGAVAQDDPRATLEAK